jgi:hypothetical protein
MNYGTIVFLHLNTIVNYINIKFCFRFMRNIIGLDKGTINQDLL